MGLWRRLYSSLGLGERVEEILMVDHVSTDDLNGFARRRIVVLTFEIYRGRYVQNAFVG